MDKQIFDEYGNYKFPTEEKQNGLNTVNQIEETKSCYSCNHYYACEDCYKAFTRSKDYFKKHIAHNREIAMRCKCYQPKIPENAVVLNVSEYVRLKSIEENIDRVIKQKCKETAEKFAEMEKERFTKAKNAYKGASQAVIYHDKMMFHKGEERAMEKAIQFVDEICKEITEGK